MTSVRHSVSHGVATVALCNSERANALDVAGWHELRSTFETLVRDSKVRVALLMGDGAHFCAGIDLGVLVNLRRHAGADTGCDGRDREALHRWILDLQDCVTAIERCPVPVIAAIHGVCFGGGVDIATACDVRVSTRDARFCVKEVDLAVTADLGVLQRLPLLIGDGRSRELALTAREFDGVYAERIGLVTGLYDSKEALHKGAQALGTSLAAKSPLALHGTKQASLAARDGGVGAGLRQVAMLNAATLLSSDLDEALTALKERREPSFRS